jgi:hypothetical protein
MLNEKRKPENSSQPRTDKAVKLSGGLGAFLQFWINKIHILMFCELQKFINILQRKFTRIFFISTITSIIMTMFLIEKLFASIVETSPRRFGQECTEIINGSNMLFFKPFETARDMERTSGSIIFKPMNSSSEGLFKFNTSVIKPIPSVRKDFVLILNKPTEYNSANCIENIYNWFAHNYEHLLVFLIAFVFSFVGSMIIHRDTYIKYWKAKKRYKQVHKETLKSLEELGEAIELMPNDESTLAPNGGRLNLPSGLKLKNYLRNK